MNIGIPDCCPICGGKLEILTSKDGIRNLFCVNEKCPSRSVTEVSTFLERLGVMGVSDTTVANWNINSIKDIVEFKANPNYKNEVKFVEELENKMWNKSKKDIFIAMSAFVYGTGRRTMEAFWDKFGCEKILDDDWVNDICSNPSVKEGIVLDFIDKVREMANLIFNDSRYNEPKALEKSNSNGMKTLESKGTICFTGKLETMTRSEAQNKAKALGYEIADGVSKTLGTLVVADAGLQGSPSSKLKKAMSMGIKIVGESEFNSWF